MTLCVLGAGVAVEDHPAILMPSATVLAWAGWLVPDVGIPLPEFSS